MAMHLAEHEPMQVRAALRRPSASLQHAGLVVELGDLTDADYCARLVDGADIIVHCAAMSRPYGPYTAFHAANVVATQRLLDAANAAGVRRVVNIGTPSIYATGRDRYDVSEAEPLPERMINHYAATKRDAEQIVLRANGRSAETISLRPRAIIGGGDTVIMPRLLAAQAAGRLRVIGGGTNVADLTTVRNVIEAVLCAMRAPASACGRAYNITNGEPVDLWKTIGVTMSMLGRTPPSRRIPKGVALAAAALSELLHHVLRRPGEPSLTRHGVQVLATAVTLDITAARDMLGYVPVQNTLDGITEFCEWYRTCSTS
ncbi:MAG: NAD-dependent epimerase/dehydratase family protein [Candidatus Kapabacteria bacterium]|nr:NAD-dependent epimerase/dehydratase family protein [Candidatus Kapabacteria bacterium]